MAESFRIAIVSGKLGDVDGVSLEVDKWVSMLHRLGHSVYTVAGKYAHPLPDVSAAHQFNLEAIRFDSPEQRHFERLMFPHLNAGIVAARQDLAPNLLASGELDRLRALGADVGAELLQLVRDHDIDVLVGENTNAMPMTLIGGLAVHELAVNQRVATIFHHHDFWSERGRFSPNRIEGLLNQIMPPTDMGSEHVVLTAYAAHILRSSSGSSRG